MTAEPDRPVATPGVRRQALEHDPGRRELLRLAALGGAALTLASCGWQGKQLAPLLGGVSRLNDRLGERLLALRGGRAREYPLARRTPEHHFPAYSITRPISDLEAAIPAAWELVVDGEVRRPLRLDLARLQALSRLTYTVKHHCVEGWTAIGTWTGVPLAIVAGLAEPTPAARYLRFDSFDAGYFNGWDLTSAFHPQTMLAYAFNDRPLDVRRGAPLRLYAPVKLGYKMTKYLVRMRFTRDRPGGTWEDRGYPWFAGI